MLERKKVEHVRFFARIYIKARLGLGDMQARAL